VARSVAKRTIKIMSNAAKPAPKINRFLLYQGLYMRKKKKKFIEDE